jgi:hypothetical protein
MGLDNVNHALGVVNVLGNIVLFVLLGWLIAVVVLYAPATGLMRGLKIGVLDGLALSLAVDYRNTSLVGPPTWMTCS